MTDEELLDTLCKARLERRGYTVRAAEEYKHLDLVERIKRRTADVYGVTYSNLAGRGRSVTVVKARQVAMYLARALTQLSYTEIGKAFERDHATVIWACRVVLNDPEMAAKAKALTLDNHNGLR